MVSITSFRLSQACFQHSIGPLSGEMVDLLREGSHCDAPKVVVRCREIVKLEGALFTCVRMVGMELTHNMAERALRPALLWHKGNFGTESEEGSRFVERILVVTTLRLQQRHVPATSSPLRSGTATDVSANAIQSLSSK